MTQVPISVYEKTNGMQYFPRMLDKIRKFAAGELREDFHHHIGKGLDARCCDYLKVDYNAVKEQALASVDDEAIYRWCEDSGRELSENDLVIWNAFVSKIGWRDHVSDRVAQLKTEDGLQDRDDIQTMADYMEIDEGRKD